jgi:hypothetical protein
MAGSVEISRHGPLFDGEIPPIIKQFQDEVERETAELGTDRVRSTLTRVLKNPTGYYRSKVTHTDDRVHDSGVVYGPWLEGTSSRNRTTRFKGYATFRRVTQALQKEMPEIAQRVLQRHIGRMN